MYPISALPQTLQQNPPDDLPRHSRVQCRLRGSGTLYRWAFERDGQAVRVAVSGPLILDDGELMVRAALDVVGLVYAGIDDAGFPIPIGLRGSPA